MKDLLERLENKLYAVEDNSLELERLNGVYGHPRSAILKEKKMSFLIRRFLDDNDNLMKTEKSVFEEFLNKLSECPLKVPALDVAYPKDADIVYSDMNMCFLVTRLLYKIHDLKRLKKEKK